MCHIIPILIFEEPDSSDGEDSSAHVFPEPLPVHKVFLISDNQSKVSYSYDIYPLPYYVRF